MDLPIGGWIMLDKTTAPADYKQITNFKPSTNYSVAILGTYRKITVVRIVRRIASSKSERTLRTLTVVVAAVRI